jgi:hypothetical protein
MGSSLPRICAGRSVLRPYEDTAARRRMGGLAPRICAGHGMPCPYEETATARRMGGGALRVFAGRSSWVLTAAIDTRG